MGKWLGPGTETSLKFHKTERANLNFTYATYCETFDKIVSQLNWLLSKIHLFFKSKFINLVGRV